MNIAGWIVSAIGHIGIVLMTLLLAWEAAPVEFARDSVIVPVEVVDVSDETNVRALAPPVPAAEEPAEEAAAEPIPEEAAPAPQERRSNDELDLAALQRDLMLDKQRERRPERAEGAPGPRAQRAVGRSDAETVRIEDRIKSVLRAHMRRCWRRPDDLPEPERLIVTVEFDLSRDGYLRGDPRVIAPTSYAFDPPMRTAVDNAVRAVRACEPYPFPEDPTVSEHFDLWRQLNSTFRADQ